MKEYRVIEAPRAKKDIKKYVRYLRDKKSRAFRLLRLYSMITERQKCVCQKLPG